jgi:hypothetical protein
VCIPDNRVDKTRVYIVLYYSLVILILLLLFLGRLINVKDVDKKDAILKSLKGIAINTKKQYIGILIN